MKCDDVARRVKALSAGSLAGKNPILAPSLSGIAVWLQQTAGIRLLKSLGISLESMPEAGKP